MTFYILHEGTARQALDRVQIVSKACDRANVEYVVIDSLSADYANLPECHPGDMLFNTGRGSERLETLLLRPWMATFHKNGVTRLIQRGDTTVHSAAMEWLRIPQPKTIHRLPATNEPLGRYVEQLGGFPIVIKVVGGTLGVGTMIIESMRSLLSVSDYLRTTGQEFILREFIDGAHVARVCVLGEQIVSSLKCAIAPDDFRTVAYRFGGQVMDFGDKVNSLAIQAANATEYEFTGVDIIIDHAGNPYVLEVNPPSNFVAYENELGIPIGDMIVTHLQNKAKQLVSQHADLY